MTHSCCVTLRDEEEKDREVAATGGLSLRVRSLLLRHRLTRETQTVSSGEMLCNNIQLFGPSERNQSPGNKAESEHVPPQPIWRPTSFETEPLPHTRGKQFLRSISGERRLEVDYLGD